MRAETSLFERRETPIWLAEWESSDSNIGGETAKSLLSARSCSDSLKNRRVPLELLSNQRPR